MISARVTAIEQYRRYRHDEDYPVEVLIRQLRGEFEPSVKMAAGTALHSYLETAAPSPDDNGTALVLSGGFAFDFSTVNTSLVIAPLREIAGSKVYVTPNGRVRVTGHVDALHGLAIDDHKLTERFDAEGYGDSYQWRLYLSIFGADKFTYNAFEGKIADAPRADGITDVEIRALHQISFYRYPELESDVLREVGLYAEFAERHLLPNVAA